MHLNQQNLKNNENEMKSSVFNGFYSTVLPSSSLIFVEIAKRFLPFTCWFTSVRW